MTGSCPRCGKTALTTGKCLDWWSLRNALRFEPDGLRFFQAFRLRRSGVAVQQLFQACLECGFLWSEVSPGNLRALIEKYGTEKAKEGLPGSLPT
jgi:hypothetical protein